MQVHYRKLRPKHKWPKQNSLHMTPKIVEDLHRAGYFVDGAILREEKWTRLARELGVDMYESDRPELEKRTAAGKNVIEKQGNI